MVTSEAPIILIAMKFKGNEGILRAGGQKLQKIFGITSFQSRESALYDITSSLEKGHFRSFAEKGRVPDLQAPLAGRLIGISFTNTRQREMFNFRFTLYLDEQLLLVDFEAHWL